MSSNNKKEPPLVEVLKVLFYFLLIALIISALSACGGGANATAHIIEETDSTVGPHFVFLAHRDEDFNKGVQSDRQRNEIKTYDKSDSAVLVSKVKSCSLNGISMYLAICGGACRVKNLFALNGVFTVLLLS